MFVVSQWKIRFDLSRKWFVTRNDGCVISVSRSPTALLASDWSAARISANGSSRHSVRETIGPPPTAPGPVAGQVRIMCH